MSRRKNNAISSVIQLKFSLLEVIHLLKDSWDQVSEKTVQNCFFKANFVIDDQTDLTVEKCSDNDFDESFEDDDLPPSAFT